MLMTMSRLLALLALAALSACNAEPSSASPLVPTPAPVPMASLIDLSSSLDALKTDFNAQRGEVRFLTLLSPT